MPSVSVYISNARSTHERYHTGKARREETQEQQQRITPAVTSADPYITNAEGRAQFEMLTKGTSTQRKNLSEEGWNNRAGGRATRYLGEHAPSSFSLSPSPIYDDDGGYTSGRLME